MCWCTIEIEHKRLLHDVWSEGSAWVHVEWHTANIIKLICQAAFFLWSTVPLQQNIRYCLLQYPCTGMNKIFRLIFALTCELISSLPCTDHGILSFRSVILVFTFSLESSRIITTNNGLIMKPILPPFVLFVNIFYKFYKLYYDISAKVSVLLRWKHKLTHAP